MDERMADFVKTLQNKIVDGLGCFESKPFLRDEWTRSEGGGGISCVVQDGDIFEKGGVNVSVINGKLSDEAAKQMRARGKELNGEEHQFFATGISLVLHPHNPMIPTVHLNYRYFQILQNGNVKYSWFGGGADLTPSFLFEEDCVHFHRCLKEACDKTDLSFYPKYKKWCDKYFFIPHRNECRGVGGIFFDDLEPESGLDEETIFSFVRRCGEAFLPSYSPIVSKRKDLSFNEKQKNWQQIRRGRYVYFFYLF
jgi:coproporphyrinogen III oxidase